MHAQRGRGGRVGWNGYGPTDYLPPSQVRSPLSAFRPRSMDVPLPFLPSPRRSKTKHTSLASTWIWTWTWTAAPGIRCDGAAYDGAEEVGGRTEEHELDRHVLYMYCTPRAGFPRFEYQCTLCLACLRPLESNAMCRQRGGFTIWNGP